MSSTRLDVENVDKSGSKLEECICVISTFALVFMAIIFIFMIGMKTNSVVHIKFFAYFFNPHLASLSVALFVELII